jgi:hypothetical protein
MLMLDTWRQTAVFNPSDPTQKKISTYAGIPGQYATYYFNREANTSSLRGLRAPMLLGLPAMFSFMGLLTYGAIGLGAYLAATKTKPGRKAWRKVKSLVPHRGR